MIDIGDTVRLVVLDIVRRGGGSGGEVGPTQPAWLARQLDSASDGWVVVITHPSGTSRGHVALMQRRDAARGFASPAFGDREPRPDARIVAKHR